ncbi:hypothetical protein AB0I53_12490 [Saccharopolyspora sp. NPDC050389]|uniref:hypothetical protein n=1 Tax=Saccharopolyspora sp. NPDC050389 TaxID=3155516 RepID=UPI0033D6C45A
MTLIEPPTPQSVIRAMGNLGAEIQTPDEGTDQGDMPFLLGALLTHVERLVAEQIGDRHDDVVQGWIFAIDGEPGEALELMHRRVLHMQHQLVTIAENTEPDDTGAQILNTTNHAAVALLYLISMWGVWRSDENDPEWLESTRKEALARLHDAVSYLSADTNQQG